MTAPVARLVLGCVYGATLLAMTTAYLHRPTPPYTTCYRDPDGVHWLWEGSTWWQVDHCPGSQP